MKNQKMITLRQLWQCRIYLVEINKRKTGEPKPTVYMTFFIQNDLFLLELNKSDSV